jgi:hypothetical protein
MAAGLGFKTFTTGEVLTAADVNGYLMQGILVFASEAARNAAITSPQEGQFAFTKDNNSLWYYTGSAWAASGATGDIEGVTAGVGISGGGTSGTVTITNDMATTITAAGDIVLGTGSGTYDNLPIGTTGQVLTADTTVSPYKVKWASAAGGTQTYTLLNSGGTSLSGSSSVQVNVTTKEEYYIIIMGASCGSRQDLKFRVNADTGNNYIVSYWEQNASATYSTGDLGAGSSTSNTSIYLTSMSTNAGSAMSAAVNIKAGNSTTLHPASWFGSATYATGNSQTATVGQGLYSGSAAITSFTVFAGANFDAGTIYVYGA